MASGTCRESLDMTYQCVINEVWKTPITKNSTIVMATSKQFLANYVLKSPASDEGHYLVGLFLEVVMDKFKTLAFPNCHQFLYRSKLCVVEWNYG